MRPRVLIFQNQIVAPNSMKITGLRKWYCQFRDIEIPPLVYSVSPQALIAEVARVSNQTYARLTGMDFQLRLNSLPNKRKDEEHGSFPFMLYQNEFVPKESLITFLLQRVDIDSRLELDPVKAQKMQLLRWLLIYKLKQALVRLLQDQRYIENMENLQNSSFTSSLLSHPVTALSILFKSIWQQEAVETHYGFTHRVDAESAISDILSKLSSELGDKPLFCSNQAKVDGICSLDILSFGFLKQMLINFSRSSVVGTCLNQLKIIKQFPSLCEFVQTMENLLRTGGQIDDVKFRQKGKEQTVIKPRIVVKNSVISKIHNSQRFRLGVSIHQKDEKETIQKRKVVWAVCISAFSLLTYYNFYRMRISS